jgi:hypothetical protein
MKWGWEGDAAVVKTALGPLRLEMFRARPSSKNMHLACTATFGTGMLATLWGSTRRAQCAGQPPVWR